MDTSIPTVTVIIPTHNYGHFIERAINSVIEQGYDNKQLVIVDDNSNDNTQSILKNIFNNNLSNINGEHGHHYTTKYKNTNVKIIVLQKESGGYGPSYARNVGIKDTIDNTDFFAFLDADDYWHQGKLSKSVNILKTNKKIGVVYSDNLSLNEKTGIIIREFRSSFDRKQLFKNCYIHSGSVVSKEALLKSGLYDETMRTAEDWDLWLRISRNFMIYHIAEPLVTATHGEYNSTNSVDKEVWQQNWEKIAYRIKSGYYE